MGFINQSMGLSVREAHCGVQTKSPKELEKGAIRTGKSFQ